VMPVEYRRALQEMARQQAADPDGLGTIEIGLRETGK
jgi:glutamate synthase (NADPH/NADH) large chain